MKYAIIYSSKTGNTKKLADTLKQILPEKSCAYFGDMEHVLGDTAALEQADKIFVGFWTDKGTCDETAAAFLKALRNKEVFLFGTAGFGGDSAYFERILASVEFHLDPSVSLSGSFMCQGKMPLSVRQRYEKMMEMPDHGPNPEAMIANFDRALTHPDAEDLENLKAAALKVLEYAFSLC